MKFIKAKRCYVCGKLFEVSEGGYLVLKKFLYLGDGQRDDIALCKSCGDSMMWNIKRATGGESK